MIVPTAVASQEKAIAIWRDCADTSAVGAATSDLAEYLWWNGETGRALRAADDAVRALETLDDDAGVARAYGRLAQVLMMSGMHAAVRPLAEARACRG